MLNFFKSKPILGESEVEFQVQTYTWLLKYFGGQDFYEKTQLILPTRDFFPAVVSSEQEAALETFYSVKKYAGMQDWSCTLIQQEQDIDVRITPTISIQNVEPSPLGTFQIDKNTQAIISYHPDLVKQPTKMVATFAHELAHYLTSGAPEAPFGGWENWEFATDITATFLGFGLFMANTATEFHQFTDSDAQGWQYNRNGYLTEAEHIFALAIFLGLQAIPVDTAKQHLKPSLRSLLTAAYKQVESLNLLSELKKVQYCHWTHNQQDMESSF